MVRRRIFLILATLVIALSLPSMGWAEFSSISMRLQGINPDLAGILTDEYTDALENPADLADVEGWRVFTNMSNLYGRGNLGNDAAFAGTTTGGTGLDQFLLGGFGNPLKGFLPNSQMGLLYNSGSRLVPGESNLADGNPNTTGDQGELIQNFAIQYDANDDGDFNDPNDWMQTINQKAKRETKTGGTDYNILYSHKLVGGSLNVGIGLFISDSDVWGNPSSKEPITASDNLEEKTGVGTVTHTQKNSLDAQEENKNQTTKIVFGGRYRVNERLNLGGRLGIIPTSRERKRESKAKFDIDNTAGAAQPITAVVTAVDGNLLSPDAQVYRPIAGNVTKGFTWTGGANWGVFDGTGFLTGDEIGTSKTNGTGFGLGFDTSYKMRDNLRFVGYIGYQSVPQDLSAKLEMPYIETLRSRMVLGDKMTRDNNTKWDISGKVTSSEFTIGGGGEAELKDNITLGFGAIYSNSTQKTDGNCEMTLNSVTLYDRNNDGFQNVPGSGDRQETVTDMGKGSFVNETITKDFKFPIGLEMNPWKRLAVRLGTTHQIQTTKTTKTFKVTSDGLQKKVIEAGGTTVISYEDTEDLGEKTIITETTARITQYYYGVGYKWSENVVFDILGFSGIGTGAGILDLASWRIGCTLRF